MSARPEALALILGEESGHPGHTIDTERIRIGIYSGLP